MPSYRLMIQGENFLVPVNGVVAKHGFITYRCVEADDPAAAELLAVQMLREDARLRSITQNPRDDPPTLQIEKISELDSVDADCPTGFIWYAANPPPRWWEFWKRR